VAPFSNATLRCLPYGRWLEIIAGLATRRPVVVVGNANLRLPDSDLSAGDFIGKLGNLGQAVINAIDGTSIRTLMALMSRATAVVTLDSGPLYIAQAVNTPAVSIWGTHAPAARIGYDSRYMDWAVWNGYACRRCPCFAYGEFPVDKCPDGPRQTVCEVLKSVEAAQVLTKIDDIEVNAAKIKSLSHARPATDSR
jgi:ADP-heptose:LPS heptosyltransferase